MCIKCPAVANPVCFSVSVRRNRNLSMTVVTGSDWAARLAATGMSAVFSCSACCSVELYCSIGMQQSQISGHRECWSGELSALQVLYSACTCGPISQVPLCAAVQGVSVVKTPVVAPALSTARTAACRQIC